MRAWRCVERASMRVWIWRVYVDVYNLMDSDSLRADEA